MKPGNVRKFLKLVGIDAPHDQPRTGWIISHCPLGPWRHEGGKSSAGRFGVKLETGDPHANCFSCGWRGTLTDLIILMRHLNKSDHHVEATAWSGAMALIEEAESTLELDLDTPDISELLLGDYDEDHVFPEWWLETFSPWDTSAVARAYLGARDLPGEVADLLDIRWDSQQKRVCFPVRDFDGRLRGLHGRAIEKDVEPRYRMYTQAGKNSPLIWLGEDHVDFDKPILVAEGPFDYGSCKRVYRNTVTPLFANPSFAKIKRMSTALEWVTFLDRGTGGDSGRAAISKCLHEDHVITHLLPPAHRKDPGECTVPELVDILGNVLVLDGPLA